MKRCHFRSGLEISKVMFYFPPPHPHEKFSFLAMTLDLQSDALSQGDLKVYHLLSSSTRMCPTRNQFECISFC